MDNTGVEKDGVLMNPFLEVIDVPKEKSKCMVNEKTGDKVYYIDKNYGLKKNLSSKMIFNSLHPISTNMCEIDITLNRI